jgi:transposase, IS30 family
LYLLLRRKGKSYCKRLSKSSGRGLIPGRRDIDERPKIVELKLRRGDWEGDTIIGAHHQGVILTLVDRKSKSVILEKLPNKCSKNLAVAASRRIQQLAHRPYSPLSLAG